MVCPNLTTGDFFFFLKKDQGLRSNIVNAENQGKGEPTYYQVDDHQANMKQSNLFLPEN